MTPLCLALSIGVAFTLKHSAHLSNVKEIFGILTIIFLGVLFVKIEKSYRKRFITAIILIVLMMLFFSLELQLSSMLTLFSERNVSRYFFGLYIPASTIVQITNAITIIVFGLLISPLFARLGLKFSVPRLILGFGAMTLCFVILYISCSQANSEGIIAAPFLVAGIAFMSIGEIFLAPLILGLVPLLSPKNYRGTMMGICLLSLAFAGLGNFIFARFISIPKEDGLINLLNSLVIYQHGFLNIIIYNIVIIGALLLVSRFLYKTIAKVNQELGKNETDQSEHSNSSFAGKQDQELT